LQLLQPVLGEAGQQNEKPNGDRDAERALGMIFFPTLTFGRLALLCLPVRPIFSIIASRFRDYALFVETLDALYHRVFRFRWSEARDSMRLLGLKAGCVCIKVLRDLDYRRVWAWLTIVKGFKVIGGHFKSKTR